MNQEKALEKAIELFGKKAVIEDCKRPSFSKAGKIIRGRYVVGKIDHGIFFSVKGTGMSWDEAITNAIGNNKQPS